MEGKLNKLSGKSVIYRLEMSQDRIQFGELVSKIAQAGGNVVGMDMTGSSSNHTIRDLTINVEDTESVDHITSVISNTKGVHLVHVSDRTFLLHLGGKIKIEPKNPIQNRDDLSRVYTPDVARVCMAIHQEPDKVYSLTI